MERRPSPKILLLQIRDTPKVRQEELTSFISYSNLTKAHIDVLNVFDTPSFTVNVVDGYDALFVGGASEASVLEPDKYPFNEPAMALLQYCVEQSIPVFASCYGFQLAVLALGGEVIHQEKNFEMGSIAISLREDARDDILFQDTPDNFLAISVHQQKALRAPVNCIELAYTEQCCHAFKYKDKPFWAFQFHPEVDRPTLVERLTVYAKKYTENNEHLDKVLTQAKDTPESNLLVRKFVERVIS